MEFSEVDPAYMVPFMGRGVDDLGIADYWLNQYSEYIGEGLTGLAVRATQRGLGILEDDTQIPWDEANAKYRLKDTSFAYSESDGMVYESSAKMRDLAHANRYAFDRTWQHFRNENPFTSGILDFSAGISAGISDLPTNLVGGIVGRGLLSAVTKLIPATKSLKSTGSVVSALTARTPKQLGTLTRTQERVRSAAEVMLGVSVIDVPSFQANEYLYGRDISLETGVAMIVGSGGFGFLFARKFPAIAEPKKAAPVPAPVVAKVVEGSSPLTTRIDLGRKLSPEELFLNRNMRSMLNNYGDKAIEYASMETAVTKRMDAMVGRSQYIDPEAPIFSYSAVKKDYYVRYLFPRLYQKFERMLSMDSPSYRIDGEEWFLSLKDGEDFPAAYSYSGRGNVQLINSHNMAYNRIKDIDGKGSGRIYRVNFDSDTREFIGDWNAILKDLEINKKISVEDTHYAYEFAKIKEAYYKSKFAPKGIYKQSGFFLEDPILAHRWNSVVLFDTIRKGETIPQYLKRLGLSFEEEVVHAQLKQIPPGGRKLDISEIDALYERARMRHEMEQGRRPAPLVRGEPVDSLVEAEKFAKHMEKVGDILGERPEAGNRDLKTVKVKEVEGESLQTRIKNVGKEERPAAKEGEAVKTKDTEVVQDAQVIRNNDEHKARMDAISKEFDESIATDALKSKIKKTNAIMKDETLWIKMKEAYMSCVNTKAGL